jgi:hypothetical protein
MYLTETGLKGVEWIQLALDTEKWWVLWIW